MQNHGEHKWLHFFVVSGPFSNCPNFKVYIPKLSNEILINFQEMSSLHARRQEKLLALSICQPVNLSISRHVNPSTCQYVMVQCANVSMCQYVNLTICQSANVSMCQSVNLLICQSVNLSICE